MDSVSCYKVIIVFVKKSIKTRAYSQKLFFEYFKIWKSNTYYKQQTLITIYRYFYFMKTEVYDFPKNENWLHASRLKSFGILSKKPRRSWIGPNGRFNFIARGYKMLHFFFSSKGFLFVLTGLTKWSSFSFAST